VFKNIEPLLKSPTELARLKFDDVKAIIGQEPFSRSEDEVIAQYNSSLYLPQVIFLGLDERHEGFVYKEHYKGQPWFAVDVTPKESVEHVAEALISRLNSEGLDFGKGRMHMSLPAEEGIHRLHFPRDGDLETDIPSRHLR
jgi:NAD+ diphosphatase